MCFTNFQTLLKNGNDPKKRFFAYFEACAENEMSCRVAMLRMQRDGYRNRRVG